MNKRKQKLEVKSEEMISAESDLSVLGDGSDWLFEGSNNVLDDIDTFTYDDMMLNIFPFPLEDEPLSQENKEVFQDLQYTSTPKSRPNTSKAFFDSGIEEPVPSCNTKGKTTYSVLHDITDKMDSTSNNSFINLSQLSEASSCDSSCKRRIPILRKNLSTKPMNILKSNLSRSISREQLIYYSGFKDYNLAVAILKHLKMPKGLFSPFKVQLITLIKLRLNLEWKDMSFRFSISDEILMNVIKQAIDIMDISFNDFLPWHVPRKVIRRSQKSFFAQSLFCLKSNVQSVIVIIDDKKPVLFVSDGYSLETSPLLILNECSAHLIPGDVLCLCDISGNVSFYKISHSSTGLGITALGETLSHCAFLDSCQKIVANIITNFSILSKPEESFNLSKLVKIAGALTNINSLDEITPAHLQYIYNKSSQAVGES